MDKAPKKIILSLGAGVQSSTMALMAAKGELPMPDCAIFADTQAEPKAVYEWLDWLENELPYPVYRVTAGSLTEKNLEVRVSQKSGRTYSKKLIPAFMLSPDGKKGLLGRGCTVDFKIVPVVRQIRKLLGLKSVRSKEILVHQWIGISMDEIIRMKDSRESWIKHTFPLIDMKMTRKNCLDWMKKNGYSEPPRSACTYCPFHSDDEWLRVKQNKEEWEAVINFEEELQKTASKCELLKGVPYLHSSCKPISEINFVKKKGYKQLELFGNECEGMCGV
jgi:hypothetical protein